MNFVILIGASGVGKSTLMRHCVSYTWPGEMKVVLLPKHTTRPARVAEDGEYTHVSPGEFLTFRQHGEYIVEYSLFGEQYGIPVRPFQDQPSPECLYIQTYPTSVAVTLAEALDAAWMPHICLLEAELTSIRARLMKRLDAHTQRSLEDRMMTADRPRREVAESIISADGAPAAVFDAFRQLIVGRL
jgi:guanylate kinase